MRYVKLPTRTFKSIELEQFDKEVREAIESGEDWKLDQLKQDLPYIDTFTFLPLKDLEGASFEPCTFVNEEDDQYQVGELNYTLVVTTSGAAYPVTLPPKEVVKLFCDWGLIDRDFLNEV